MILAHLETASVMAATCSVTMIILRRWRDENGVWRDVWRDTILLTSFPQHRKKREKLKDSIVCTHGKREVG